MNSSLDKVLAMEVVLETDGILQAMAVEVVPETVGEITLHPQQDGKTYHLAIRAETPIGIQPPKLRHNRLKKVPPGKIKD